MSVKHLMAEVGYDIPLKMGTDSSSAKGIVNRHGCGRVKHLEARQMWLQEKVHEKTIEIKKIARVSNPADALTHTWTAAEGERHFPEIGMHQFVDKTGCDLLMSRGGVGISKAFDAHCHYLAYTFLIV